MDDDVPAIEIFDKTVIPTGRREIPVYDIGAVLAGKYVSEREYVTVLNVAGNSFAGNRDMLSCRIAFEAAGIDPIGIERETSDGFVLQGPLNPDYMQTTKIQVGDTSLEFVYLRSNPGVWYTQVDLD